MQTAQDTKGRFAEGICALPTPGLGRFPGGKCRPSSKVTPFPASCSAVHLFAHLTEILHVQGVLPQFDGIDELLHEFSQVIEGVVKLRWRRSGAVPESRALHLTQFGEGYLATCGEVLRLMDAAELGAATERERPYGLLTVTPRLGDVRRVLVAAPVYLKRHGLPRTPSMLREHACIMERDGAETDLWRFSAPPRRSLVPAAVRPRLRVNSAEAAVDSAVDGHGIARVMSYQAAKDVAAGKLVVLLAQYEPPPIPVHLLLPSARSKTAKQRSFVEFAAPQLRSRLTRAAKEMGAKR